MTVFALVHGAWHGAWCWARLGPLLEQAGHRVIAPDLPGLGCDRTPLSGLCFADWTGSVAASLRQAGERVVLVGHSRGGAVISNVAEQAPELVDRLIYLAAFLLRDGQSVQEEALRDRESSVGEAMARDGASGWLVRDEAAAAVFYGQCEAADIAFARARLRTEPFFGLTTPVHVTDARFGSVARYYIECSRDKAVSLQSQRRMQAGLPCRDTITLDTDHSPFFSAPEALAGALVDLAGR